MCIYQRKRNKEVQLKRKSEIHFFRLLIYFFLKDFARLVYVCRLYSLQCILICDTFELLVFEKDKECRAVKAPNWRLLY